MTYEKQDIKDHFYEGNKKIIKVTIYEPTEEDDYALKDLTNAELTYVIMDRKDYNIIHLRKSSYNGDTEIKVTGLGLCEIYIDPPDTINLHGTFRHHLNVVDQYGYPATVFTGLVEIHETSAKTFRLLGKPAYLIGATS